MNRHAVWGGAGGATAPQGFERGEISLLKMVNNDESHGFSLKSGPNSGRKLFLRGVSDHFLVKTPKKFRACGAIFLSWDALGAVAPPS